MPKKIRCVFHAEETPSLNLYSNGFFCFGCGARGKLSELEGVDLPPAEELEPEDAEDLGARFAYIDSLPHTEVRGLSLPADHRGYYLVWPCRGYYKLRVWEPGKGPKYLGARGHKRPLFWANQADFNDTLVIVEGELNALSIAEACPEIDVVSPGGVGDFTEKKVKHQLTEYERYHTILVVADADKPGAEAIINTLSVLWANRLQAAGLPMQSDANEILVNFGPERLRQEIQQGIERALARSLK